MRRELIETQAAQPDIVAGAVADVGRVDNQLEIGKFVAHERRAAVGAILDGWNYAFAHEDEAVAITLKYMRSANPEDARHQKNMLLKMKTFMLVEKYGNKIGWSDRQRWQEALDRFLQEQPGTAFTLDDILTNQYAEAYYQGR